MVVMAFSKTRGYAKLDAGAPAIDEASREKEKVLARQKLANIRGQVEDRGHVEDSNAAARINP
jgi:hypothetical protein